MVGGDSVKFWRGFADKDVGEFRAASDGGYAALSFEAGGGDAAIFDADGQAQNVSANGICHFNCGGGVGEVPHVVGGAKVVEDNFVEQCTG